MADTAFDVCLWFPFVQGFKDAGVMLVAVPAFQYVHVVAAVEDNVCCGLFTDPA
jgi:hypothetical protein